MKRPQRLHPPATARSPQHLRPARAFRCFGAVRALAEDMHTHGVSVRSIGGRQRIHAQAHTNTRTWPGCVQKRGALLEKCTVCQQGGGARNQTWKENWQGASDPNCLEQIQTFWGICIGVDFSNTFERCELRHGSARSTLLGANARSSC